jgi:hypothetical protein
VGVLGQQDEVWHPLAVGREPLRFRVEAGVVVHEALPGNGKPPLGFLPEEIEASEKQGEVVAEKASPPCQDVLELAGQRLGFGTGGAEQHVHQVLLVRSEAGLPVEPPVQGIEDVPVRRSIQEGGLVEELRVWPDGGVAVRHPQQEQLHPDPVAVGRFFREPGGNLPAISRGRRVGFLKLRE